MVALFIFIYYICSLYFHVLVVGIAYIMSSQKRAYGYRFGLDMTTGQSLHHVSFILRHFLPLEFVSDEAQMRAIECDIFDHRRSSPETNVPGQQYSILTGSLAEGLAVPDYHWVKNNTLKYFCVSRDRDEMVYENNEYDMHSLPGEGLVDQKGPVFEIETLDEHRNYGRLRVSDSYKKARELSGSPVLTKYLDIDTAKESLLGVCQKNYPKQFGPVEVHGPSVTLVAPPSLSSLDRDLCLSIRFKEWPAVASEWRTRLRKSSWPNKYLIDKILHQGHFMVPAGCKGVSDDKLSWRFSFSLSEKLLSRSLSTLVRKVYIIIKIIHSFFLKNPGALPTYALKTLLFWHCENYETHLWREGDIASIVLSVLSKIEYCLARGEIAHYFIPSVNLLQSAPPEHLATLSKILRHVKSNLFNCMINIASEVHFINLNPNFSTNFQGCASNAVDRPLEEIVFKNDIEKILFEHTYNLIGLLKVQEMQIAEGPDNRILFICQAKRALIVRILGAVWKELAIEENTCSEKYICNLLFRIAIMRYDELTLAKVFVWGFMQYMMYVDSPPTYVLKDKMSSIFDEVIKRCTEMEYIKWATYRMSSDDLMSRLSKMKQYIIEDSVLFLTFAGDNSELHYKYLQYTAPPARSATKPRNMEEVINTVFSHFADQLPDPESFLRLLDETVNTNTI